MGTCPEYRVKKVVRARTADLAVNFFEQGSLRHQNLPPRQDNLLRLPQRQEQIRSAFLRLIRVKLLVNQRDLAGRNARRGRSDVRYEALDGLDRDGKLVVRDGVLQRLGRGAFVGSGTLEVCTGRTILRSDKLWPCGFGRVSKDTRMAVIKVSASFRSPHQRNLVDGTARMLEAFALVEFSEGLFLQIRSSLCKALRRSLRLLPRGKL